MENTEEIWLPIPGYEAYYSVSSLGRIKRTVSGRGGAIAGNILKPRKLPQAKYLVICLSGGCKANTRWHTVHSLVCAAFIGPRPEGLQINHKDGDSYNNGSINLEYCTSQENNAHCDRMGLRPRGDNHGARKHPESRPRGEASGRATFTTEEIISIRNRHCNGERIIDIARSLGRHNTTIGYIINRVSWKHIP